MPGNDGVHVHLLQDHAAVGNRLQRHHFKISDPVLGVLPSVRFDQARSRRQYPAIFTGKRPEHVVGLAHARRRPKIDAQFCRFLGLSSSMISAIAQPTSTG